jgi:hypothetical protein
MFLFTSVYISVFTVFVGYAYSRNAPLCFLLCSVLFVSGPAHILCLTVASGWNKERCILEILPLLYHRTFCNVLVQNQKFDMAEIFATFVRPYAIIWLWINLTYTVITEIFKTSAQIRIWTWGLHFRKAYIIISKNPTKHLAPMRLIFILLIFVLFRGICCHTSLTVYRSTIRS